MGRIAVNGCSFIRAASCGALLAGALPSVSHVAAENRPPIPGPLGVLYDSTLCVGCQACVAECQDISFPECNPQEEQTWSSNDKLSPYINNIIQVRINGTGVNKDQEENGYAHIKKQCIHYVDPNCISAYPISALKKDPKTGTVHCDEDVCTGCRYCMVVCPCNVSKCDYSSPFGALHEYKLCNQRGVECLGKDGLPGCVEVCPAGAVISGTRGELVAEAEKRLALKPDSEYHYSRQTLRSGDAYLHTVPKYYPRLYDEREDGGTQVLILTGVLYESLDLPKLDDLSADTRSEHARHALYRGMMLPLAVLADLTVLVRRSAKNDHHDRGDDHESWSTTARRQNHQ